MQVGSLYSPSSLGLWTFTQCCLVAKLCLPLCNSMNCSPLGSFVHEFPRQEYWSGFLFPSPRDHPDARIVPASPELAGEFFTTKPPEKLFTEYQRCLVQVLEDPETTLATHTIISLKDRAGDWQACECCDRSLKLPQGSWRNKLRKGSKARQPFKL